MLHEPASQCGPDHAADYKMRLGVYFFIVYCLVYAGFVAINVASPQTMETLVVAGLNLAVVYGFGLIVFALVLALLYNGACTRREAELAAASERAGEAN